MDTDDLQYVSKAIKLAKKALNGRVPLIGFAGAPWTILAYMVEGHGSKTFSKARKFLYAEPEAAHQLLQKIVDSTITYLKAQIAAGADMVQLFDSWAGILNPDQYSTFGLPYISRICDAIKESSPPPAAPLQLPPKGESANAQDNRRESQCTGTPLIDKTVSPHRGDGRGAVPIIVFAKGAYFARKELGKLKCDVVGLDWNMEIEESRQLIGDNKTLQGNLDPCLLYADMNTIKSETIKMLKTFGPKRHIANLGHGVYPDTPLDNVKCFVDTVKSANNESIRNLRIEKIIK